MKRFSETEVFDSIYSKLEQMEEQKKVDLSINNDLDVLMNRFRQLESFWINNRKMRVEDAFLFYHCSRNCWNILGKMKDRFSESQTKHLNPQIVKDASPVLSSLQDLYNLVGETPEERINPQKATLVVERLKKLREMASTVSMVPSYQEEAQDLNILQLRKRFAGIAESLQAEYFEG